MADASHTLSDQARIFVRGGHGGNGCLSFRREAGVPRGGPNGGDGGRGGDVVLVCDDSLRDLRFFARSVHFTADRGRHGEGSDKHGASGGDEEVRVPPGTVVTDADGGRWDLVRHGQRVRVARGGSGGRGNARFAHSTRQTPRFAERGLDGEETWVDLRLKLLADVGLVGLPNAGKSSLLGRLTAADPKVGGYPFTTLQPHLGTLQGSERQLVLADIPGLIEGASVGRGLGHEFLAHVERCRLLVHVVDVAPLDGSDPVVNHAKIEAELAAYAPRLAELPRVLVLSKADLVDPDVAERVADAWRARLHGEPAEREAWEDEPAPATPVLVTSSATHAGLDELAALLLRTVPPRTEADEAAPALAGLAPTEALAEHRTYRPAAERGTVVTRTGPEAFRVRGEAVERLLRRHDPDNEDAMAYVEERLRRTGVIAALRDAGLQPGDDVEIAGIVFELDPQD